jgi:hypothetical protein
MTERMHRMKSVKCLVSGWDGEIMVSSYLPTIDSLQSNIPQMELLNVNDR